MSTAFGCVANTIRLRSGLYFDLRDPKPDQFTLGDIAGALSKICRFGGQIDQFYSVAEHSVLCAQQGRNDNLSIATQLALLMHDATEAFAGDVVKPLKTMLPEYPEIERRIEAAISEKFGIDFECERSFVREIDQAMLIAERVRLFSRDDVEWTGESQVRVLSPQIFCWGPKIAEMRFDSAARTLGITCM